MRSERGACGVEGLLWEEKPSAPPPPPKPNPNLMADYWHASEKEHALLAKSVAYAIDKPRWWEFWK
jgi:hypothetical protein